MCVWGGGGGWWWLEGEGKGGGGGGGEGSLPETLPAGLPWWAWGDGNGGRNPSGGVAFQPTDLAMKDGALHAVKRKEALARPE